MYVIKINYVPKVLLIKFLSLFQVTACTPNPCGCVGCMGSIAQLAYTYIQLLGHVTEDQ